MKPGKAIPSVVRWIVVRLSTTMCEEDIAMYTDISIRSVRNILSNFKLAGTVTVPKSERPQIHRTLCNYDVEYMHKRLSEMPDIYLSELQSELQDVCGTVVSIPTIWRTLVRGGYTMKQLSRTAIERSEEKRQEFAHRIGTYDACQLVFVDESAVDRRTTYRGKAWAIRGRKASRKTFFCRGQRYSVLPALALDDGIIHCEIVEGAFNTAMFYGFISRLLDEMKPFPAPKSVIIMDNCRIHKHTEILELIESRGMRYEFLPPYSPDYNPIELAFSSMKYYLRRKGEYVRMAMSEMDSTEVWSVLLEALYQISPEDVFGWYRHCGYV